MVITLTPDIEQALAEQAREQGVTPEQLALESLRAQFLPPGPEGLIENQGTLADFLGASIGVLHSGEHVAGGAQMSEDTGGKFAAALVKKRQQDHL
jgi:hypothetical protein